MMLAVFALWRFSSSSILLLPSPCRDNAPSNTASLRNDSPSGALATTSEILDGAGSSPYAQSDLS